MGTKKQTFDDRELKRILQLGEGATIEFKRSTAELREGFQTLCAFLNGSGGMLLFGIRPNGTPEGQDVSDKTLREVAQAFDLFEPHINVPVERFPVKDGKEVLILRVPGNLDTAPFIYDGRPYERVESTTRKMPQSKYNRLLLERTKSIYRWESQPVEGIKLSDLDREEILRTRELAIQQRRISAETSRNIGDILDRLNLRRDGIINQAAQILFGTKFIDYPQCLLKMGRFRGTKITGEIVDNRQEYMNAFTMVREGMSFIERTLPLGAKFPEGKIFREDRLPIPPNALREILLNAVMHRDYSYVGGHVAIAIFDDRVEIRSYGRLPAGVTIEQLSGPHLSELRNPRIAEAFHRTGAVEIWGRGTNRVIDECKSYGIDPPTFEEMQGFLIVTFRANIVGKKPALGKRAESGAESGADSKVESTEQNILALLVKTPLSPSNIVAGLGKVALSGAIKRVIRDLLQKGYIERTIPEKPNSRLQKYRLTADGHKALKEGNK